MADSQPGTFPFLFSFPVHVQAFDAQYCVASRSVLLTFEELSAHFTYRIVIFNESCHIWKRILSNDDRLTDLHVSKCVREWTDVDFVNLKYRLKNKF